MQRRPTTEKGFSVFTQKVNPEWKNEEGAMPNSDEVGTDAQSQGKKKSAHPPPQTSLLQTLHNATHLTQQFLFAHSAFTSPEACFCQTRKLNFCP